jgi:hypothetical protein
MPADTTGPRCINCYLVEVQDCGGRRRRKEVQDRFGASIVLAAMETQRHAAGPEIRLSGSISSVTWCCTHFASTTRKCETGYAPPLRLDRTDQAVKVNFYVRYQTELFSLGAVVALTADSAP